MSDTERLIEEAGRVVAQAEKQSALDAKYPPCTCSAPPRGHTMRQHDYRRLRVDELRAVLSACGNLVTALRAERERAEFLRRCWEKAEQAYSGMFRVAVFAIIIGLMIVIGLAFARAQP